MNYNNFSSRISKPKSSEMTPPAPSVAPEKKIRKRPRRLPGTVAALILLFPCMGIADDVRAPVAAMGILPASSQLSDGLSPMTEVVILVGLAVAGIQGRLLLSRREVVW